MAASKLAKVMKKTNEKLSASKFRYSVCNMHFHFMCFPFRSMLLVLVAFSMMRTIHHEHVTVTFFARLAVSAIRISPRAIARHLDA
jgi:hypothetical protein